MRRLRRRLRRHSGITARRVAVRAAWPRMWRLGVALLILAAGYALGYWNFAGSDRSGLQQSLRQLRSENLAMQATVAQMQRQLQVERAAQGNLAKEIAALQDENMQLKEEIVFYKSILAESGSAAGAPKLHSIKLSKGEHAGEYRYNILLVQTGRHNKPVQGSLRLLLNTSAAGKPLVQGLETNGQDKVIKVDFKYSQRFEGRFSVPPSMSGQSLQVQFTEAGKTQPTLSQTVNLPA